MQTAKLINLPLPERMHAMELLWSSLSQGAQAQDVFHYSYDPVFSIALFLKIFDAKSPRLYLDDQFVL